MHFLKSLYLLIFSFLIGIIAGKITLAFRWESQKD